MLSAAAQAVWDAEKSSASSLAGRFRALDALLVAEEAAEDSGQTARSGSDGDSATERDLDPIDPLDTVRAALALRVTDNAAQRELQDAARAVRCFVRCLDLMERGEFPSWWFSTMLRISRKLKAAPQRLVDLVVSTWSVDITAERFVTLLRALVALLAERDRLENRTVTGPVRRVELSTDGAAGTGAIILRGAIPEILARWKELDEAARAIQVAQRRALRDGDAIPWDADGEVARTGRTTGLDTLRSMLLMGAELDVEGVTIPAPRFRVNVTVPVMTLLGASDAPGMVDGCHPIPAEMARELAGGEPVWHRVLTDPTSGAFLPLPADRYQPTQTMLEHLRLRGPRCAVPGCTRPVSWASECDHIEEFRHGDPAAGGLTEIENLHLLCWQHHLDKTLGLLDPTRLAHREDDPGSTRWRIGPEGAGADEVVVDDDVDIGTLFVIAELEHSWQVYCDRRDRAGEAGMPVGAPAPRSTGPSSRSDRRAADGAPSGAGPPPF